MNATVPRIAIVVPPIASSRSDRFGDFIRLRNPVHPDLKDRHVYQSRLWDPATEAKELNETVAKIARLINYQGLYAPQPFIVQVAADPEAAARGPVEPHDLQSALDTLARLITPAEQPLFIEAVRKRFIESHVPPPPPAPPVKTPTEAELLNAAGAGDKDEAVKEDVKEDVKPLTEPEPKESVKEVPTAGELVIPPATAAEAAAKPLSRAQLRAASAAAKVRP